MGYVSSLEGTNYYCKLYDFKLLLQITIPNYHYNLLLQIILQYLKSLLQIILWFPLLSATSWVLNFSLPPKNSRDPRPNVKSWRRTSVCCERRRCERMIFFGGAGFLSEKKTHHPLGFKQKSPFGRCWCTSLGGENQIFSYIFDFHPYLGMMIQFD